MGQYYLYGLILDGDKYPFYIGITRNLYERFIAHKSANSTVSNHIKNGIKIGFNCSIIELLRGNKFDMMVSEISTIKYYSAINHHLLNIHGVKQPNLKHRLPKNKIEANRFERCFIDFKKYISDDYRNSVTMVKMHVAKKHKLNERLANTIITSRINEIVNKKVNELLNKQIKDEKL